MLNYPEGSVVTAYIQSLSVLIKRTGNRMYRRELSLGTTEWPILVLLARGEPLGINQICERLDRDKGHVSRDVAALASRGLVKKRRDAIDSRHVLIEFAPDAEDQRQSVMDIMRERSDKLTAGLTEEDLANLKRMLMIMNRNARDMRGEDLEASPATA